MRFIQCCLLGVLCVGLLVGCDKPQAEKTPAQDAPAQGAAATKPAEPSKAPLVPTVQVADWCKEHGVPESICTRCNDSLVAGFKQKGDWCSQHNLPESQCFKCNPELQQKFAAAYKAKYGKEPPAMESEKQ